MCKIGQVFYTLFISVPISKLSWKQIRIFEYLTNSLIPWSRYLIVFEFSTSSLSGFGFAVCVVWICSTGKMVFSGSRFFSFSIVNLHTIVNRIVDIDASKQIHWKCESILHRKTNRVPFCLPFVQIQLATNLSCILFAFRAVILVACIIFFGWMYDFSTWN